MYSQNIKNSTVFGYRCGCLYHVSSYIFWAHRPFLSLTWWCSESAVHIALQTTQNKGSADNSPEYQHLYVNSMLWGRPWFWFTIFKVLCFLLWITEVINTAFVLTLSSVLPSSWVVKACQLREHYTQMCLLTWFNGWCCREWSLWIEICLTAIKVLKQKCF